jgi:hypothetical protein
LSRAIGWTNLPGKKGSSGFAMSCGDLWWIPGFVGIVVGLQWYLPRFAERIFVRKMWRNCGEWVAECGDKMVL